MWLIFLSPALWLLWLYWQESLGINPLQKLERTTGNTTLLLLIVTLSITPLRHYLAKLCTKFHAKDGKRLADWNWLMRSRRMIGLYSFFYASLHLCLYLSLDIAFKWQWFIADLQEKPYIMAGLLAFALLIPLAITSTNKMMARLGRNWRRIHKFIYLIVILAISHYWWLSKVGVYDAWLYTLLITLLLSYRVLVKFKLINPNPADNGMETEDKNKSEKLIEKRGKKRVNIY